LSRADVMIDDREKIEVVIRLVLLYDRLLVRRVFFLAAVLAYASLSARSKQVRGLGAGLRDVFARIRRGSPLKDCLTFADQR
jgi:hypothetical protein